MSKELRMMRGVLEAQNRNYPNHLVEVPDDKWPPQDPNDKAKRIEVFRSRYFLAQLFSENGHLRLSVNRTKLKSNGHWEDGITWDELMRLKTEAGLGHLTAYEVYPPDRDVVNVANMRHLWISDVYAWKNEKVSEECRRTHVQRCHCCEDLNCGDNISPEAIAAKGKVGT